MPTLISRTFGVFQAMVVSFEKNDVKRLDDPGRPRVSKSIPSIGSADEFGFPYGSHRRQR